MMSRKGSLFHHLRSDESKHIRQLVRNRVLNARDHESNIFEIFFCTLSTSVPFRLASISASSDIEIDI